MRWLTVFLIGCTSSGGGEAQKGDAALHWGNQTFALATASAIADPAGMRIQLGNDNVDCATDLDKTEPPAGDYIYFKAPAATGPIANVSFTLIVFQGNNISIDVTGGTAQIDTFDTRVTGTATFMTTDQNATPDGMVTITGSFDVKKCF